MFKVKKKTQFFSRASIVDLEQVNVIWVYIPKYFSFFMFF